MSKKGAISLNNRLTKVTTSSATLIDNIFTNCVFNISLKKRIIKTSIPETTLQYLQESTFQMKKLKLKNKI